MLETETKGQIALVEEGRKLADSGKLNGRGLKHCQGNVQVSPEISAPGAIIIRR